MPECFSGIFCFLNIIDENLSFNHKGLPHKTPSDSLTFGKSFICYLCPAATAIKTSISSYYFLKISVFYS